MASTWIVYEEQFVQRSFADLLIIINYVSSNLLGIKHGMIMVVLMMMTICYFRE